MTERDPTRPDRVEADTIDNRETVIEPDPAEPQRPVDDRGGFRDTAPNPHDEDGAAETAARTTGAMAGMFFPVVIIAIIAIVVILYFVLR